jgi:hypothetical protein
MLIARALLLDVRLLVADELISMLDASTRVDVLNLLVSLKRKGLGILFITHDLSLGNYISDRTVILRHGAVAEMGDTTKVFGNPQHSYTKSLLTAVPQLHKKWEHVQARALAAAPANGSGPAPAPGPEESAPESRRYSKSSIYPGKKGHGLPEGPGPRPSLMDIPDAPWQRKGLTGVALRKELLSEPPPPLVQFEPGHFVAVEE